MPTSCTRAYRMIQLFSGIFENEYDFGCTWGSMRGSKKEKGRGVRIDALLGKLIKTNYVLIKRLPIKTEFRKGHHPHIPRKTKLTLRPFLAGKEFYIRAWTLSIESRRGSRIFSRGRVRWIILFFQWVRGLFWEFYYVNLINLKFSKAPPPPRSAHECVHIRVFFFT